MNGRGLSTIGLSFSTSVLQVAYDEKTEAVYIYDGSGTTKVWPVSETLAKVILMGDYSLLETTMKGARQKLVARPKGLKWYRVEKRNSVTLYRVNSSSVDYVGFDRPNRKLYVIYRNGSNVYEYSNIDEQIYNGIMNAESLGSFLHFFVKINDVAYPFRKLGKGDVTISGASLGNSGTPHEQGYLVDKTWNR